ncbi:MULTISPECIES: glycosyltransferase family 4 protein [unclassified Coleofasciculus]|uniref:glycosyltransferase family 4 protein n=1 Tax=unclassified Coleofasciculus TaxID=2692782 RepID=UPI00187F77DC|nr:MULTISPECIES: glycosyltransferase [unclassified Coleofasciculus]MBE9126893.1 glycosyltransferase [Coleofasciculus sp. LEGE 07081]MBE9150211.1 glycosyltransferase [Coleofasciculus sp. LEGE 07092]
MTNLISFRPSVIGNNTAFEAQVLIYKYLQEHYGYTFTMIKSEEDKYDDQAFQIISIPKQAWKAALGKLGVPKLGWTNRYLDPIFAQAHGILTVDPTIYLQGLLAVRTAHRAKRPIWFDASLTLVGNTQNLSWQLKRRFLLRKALHQTTGIIVTVPKCIERFQSLGLFNEVIASKFTIMGHPVDTQKFTPQPTKQSEQDGILRVLVVSRMVPEKGLLYILEAMTPLLRSRCDLQLQFLGSGSMKSLLKSEVAERDLKEKVVFLNPVSHREVPNVLGSADIFVNHAISLGCWEEYFGVANLEAMSCGLPCVLTNCGGISYAIREKDVAVFVEERNIIQLQKAINHLLDSKKERCELGKRARTYVECGYALPRIVEKYHHMITKHISNNQLIRNYRSP